MELNDSFWRLYELDLCAELKVAYLNWAMRCLQEPPVKYRHLLIWEDKTNFCIVHSKYGRTFSLSPWGCGVRGIRKRELVKKCIETDECDRTLKSRLSQGTAHIRDNIRTFIRRGDIESASDTVLTWFWMKIGPHEILFDRLQYGLDEKGRVRKGKWAMEDESEGWTTLTGIRNRILNCIRYGEELQEKYVINLDKQLPGFSRNTKSTFLASGMSWQRFACCCHDCGPVYWSKNRFVHFHHVQDRMKKIGWPYKGTASSLLRPLYNIRLNYRRPPIRRRGEPDDGYSLTSMRRRACEIWEIIDRTLDEINHIRKQIR